MQKLIGGEGNNEIDNDNKCPSKTAETMALIRTGEWKRPDNERICHDPYAIRFVSQETLEFIAHNPEKFKVFIEHNERLVPGAGNSVVARVRYIDDIVMSSISDGLEQLVILGAGYDTRAYRIEGLKKVKVFEIDHPDTQKIKKEKIKEIFGSLPSHVTYLPVDMAVNNLGQQLVENGYNLSQKTLYVMEGLLMYIPPLSVDEILFFIVNNSGKDSTVVFDYIPLSVVDGTCELEAGKNWRKFVMDAGEPFLFGIEDGEIETFLVQRGFSKIKNMTSNDYKNAYFHGMNASRIVNTLHSFVYAMIK